MHRHKLAAVLLAVLVLPLALGWSSEARAQCVAGDPTDLTVTRTGDDLNSATWTGTLRAAIACANSGAAISRTILFTVAPGATITLDEALPAVVADISINTTGPVTGIKVTSDVDTDLLLVSSLGTARMAEIEFESIEVSSGGLLQLNIGDTGLVYTKPVDGAGSVTKAGSGVLDFQSTVLASLFRISQGELKIDPDDLNADLNIDNFAYSQSPAPPVTPSVVRFFEDETGTYSGDIDDLGGLPLDTTGGKVIKDGSGTVIFTGVHSYTGGTDVLGGTLQGNTGNLQGDIDISAGATVRFDQTTRGSFTGLLTGPGAVVKAGASTLVFDTPSPTSGLAEIAVEAGTLRGEDTDDVTAGVQPTVLESPLLVQGGGTFAGFAQLDADAAVQGRMHPELVASGAPAAISGTGRITFEPGATLIVEVRNEGAAAGDSSLITTTGGVVFQSGLTLDVRIGGDAPINYTSEQQFLVVQNVDEGASAAAPFTSFNTPSAFLTARAEIQTGALYVYVDRTDAESVAVTPNQRQVAVAYDELIAPGNSTADTSGLENAMLSLSSAQAPAAFDVLGGDMLASFTTARFTNSERFAHTVAERFTASQYELRYPKTGSERFTRNAMADGSPFGRFATPASDIGTPMWSGLLGASPYTFSPGAERDGVGVFIDGFGVFSSLDGEGSASSIDTQIYGTTFGLDYRLPRDIWLPSAEHIRIGVAGSYARSSFSSSPSPASGTSNSYYASLYGAYTLSRFYVGAFGRYGYTDMETTRSVEIGTLAYPFLETALGSTNGNEAEGYVETGALIGAPETLLLRPVFAFNYTWVEQAAFSETGAPTTGLDVQGTSAQSMLTTLGFRLSKIIPFDAELFGGGPDNEFGVEPELRFGWNHEFGDTLRPVDATFSAAINGGAFTVGAAQSQVDSFTVGVGHTMRIDEIALIAMHYDARIDSTRIDHTIRAAVYLAW